MTVGNFVEVINSTEFDSIRAKEDVLVVYALDNRDYLTSLRRSPISFD